MSAGALAFMAVTWAGVLGLVAFCFVRVLRGTARARETASRPRTGGPRRKKGRRTS